MTLHSIGGLFRELVMLIGVILAVLALCFGLYWIMFDTEMSPGFEMRLWKKISVGMSEEGS